jgi:ABC-2 type transport system permease protein
MTTPAATRATAVPPGRYRLVHVIRSERTKLRSRSSFRWLLAAMVAGTLALGITDCLVEASAWAHMTAASRARFDPANISLAGLAFAPLAIGIAGVLVMSGEYGNGLIGATLAAVPRRRLVLVAKAAVLAAVTLAVGEVTVVAAFLAGQRVLAGHAPLATLAQPGVLRAVALSGAYLGLLALFGLGLGAIVRRSAGAISVYAGLVLVLPYPLLALPGNPARFAPETVLASSVAAVRPQPRYLPPGWEGFALMALYTAVALGLGGWLLSRRDAGG